MLLSLAWHSMTEAVAYQTAREACKAPLYGTCKVFWRSGRDILPCHPHAIFIKHQNSADNSNMSLHKTRCLAYCFSYPTVILKAKWTKSGKRSRTLYWLHIMELEYGFQLIVSHWGKGFEIRGRDGGLGTWPHHFFFWPVQWRVSQGCWVSSLCHWVRDLNYPITPEHM